MDECEVGKDEWGFMGERLGEGEVGRRFVSMMLAKIQYSLQSCAPRAGEGDGVTRGRG